MTKVSKGKLRELLLPTFHEIGNEMSQPEKEAYAIVEKELDDILGEPRKDFPIEKVTKKIGDRELKVISDKFHVKDEDDFAVIARFMDWYEKWFGEGNESV